MADQKKDKPPIDKEAEAAKEKKKLHLLLQSRIAVGIVAVVLLLLGCVLIAQGFIDTHEFRKEIIAAIKEKTGKEPNIKGRVGISLLPVPSVYVPGIELRDAESDTPAPAITVELLRLDVDLTTIFSDHPKINGVTLERPVLELVRSQDNLIHWDWLNAGLIKSFAGEGSSGSSLRITVVDGRIAYHDDRTDKGMNIDNVQFTASSSKHLKASGSFTFFGHDLKFNSDTDIAGKDASTNKMPFNFRLYADAKNEFKLDGSMDLSGDMPKVNAKLALQTDDMLVWIKAKTEQKKEILSTVTNEFTRRQEDKTTLPVQFTSDWSQDGIDVDMSNVVLQGMNSAGTGKMKLTWTDWQPTIITDMKFSALDYFQWRTLFMRAFTGDKGSSIGSYVNEETGQPENPLPKYLRVTLDVAADKLYYGSQTWNDAKLSASLADAEVTVDQFSIKLPGDASLTLFGIISQGSTKGLRFEGSMETQGKSLRHVLTIFDESAADLPETGFGDFYARSNLFISSEQMRLSEADVKISDLRLNGGLVAYYDANPRLEADVKLKDINFDYFRDVWRDRQKAAGAQDFFLKFDKTMNFNWLKKLRTNIDFKFNVERFTFLDRKGDQASFRVFVKEYEFGIYDIHFYYPNEMTEANFHLNVAGDQPLFSVMLNTSQINTDYFSVTPDPVKEEKPDPREAKKLENEKLLAPELPMPVPDGMKPTDMKPDGGITPEDMKNEPREGPASPPEKQPDDKKAEDKKAAATSAAVAAAGAAAARKEPAPAPIPAPAPAPAPAPPAPVPPAVSPDSKKVTVTPQSQTITLAAADEEPLTTPPKAADSLEDIRRNRRLDTDSAAPSKKVWSEDVLDMSWMDGFNAVFDISIGKLTSSKMVLDRVKLQARLTNNLLTFQNFTFVYWQGRCSVLGSMYGGKVPGVSISYTLYNVELHDMLKKLIGRDNISGRASISGSLTTSGVNLLSWVSQSDAKVVLAARGVKVDNVNLQGVVDTVMVSRTAADVFNNVNQALVNGTTEMNIDGNINVKNGVMRTPGITLRDGPITGDLTGEVRLVPWLLSLSTMFQFPAMTSETIPTMTVQLDGPIDNFDLKTDTASLEAFVAKRIISR